MAAALEAKDKLLQTLAERLGADASELDVKDGYILRNDAPAMDWNEACTRLPADGIVGRGTSRTGRAFGGEGHSNGVQFVDLVVDAETGVVRVNHIVAIQACGRVVARKTTESQIIGGVIQGLSFALFEDKILDRNVGAMVNPNLEMYKIAGAADVPHIEPVLWAKDQTGVRSLGEPPTIPTAGAIACAVFNAIGAPVRHLPLTPDKVLGVLEGAAS
jgi:xanthine dehydrogenase YagR molybdenum-binding subunit